MNPDIYKLLIVDDHPIVAEGIVSIASQQSNILCKSITRMENLLPTISAESFDLCIIDLELPEINGFQLIHLLQEQMPDCKILIYTMHEEPWVIHEPVRVAQGRVVCARVRRHGRDDPV